MKEHKSFSTHERGRLLKAAREAAKKAYAPYSKFKVGAAILTEQGNIFTGCNVENASYGLTICAERAAIFSAIAKEGGDKMKIKGLAVLNDRNVPCSPCGACRQVVFEFARKAIVIFQGDNGVQIRDINDLLPNGFVPI